MAQHNNTNFEMDVAIRAASQLKPRWSLLSVKAGFLHDTQELLLVHFSISIPVCFIYHLLYTQKKQGIRRRNGGQSRLVAFQQSVPAVPHPWGSLPALWLLFSGSWMRSCRSRHHQTAGKLSGSPLWSPFQPEIRGDIVLWWPKVLGLKLNQTEQIRCHF